MSSILTSGAVIEFLDITSLLKHAIIVNDYRNNTFIAKDGQDTSYSLKNKPATKDHPDDTFIAKDR